MERPTRQEIYQLHAEICAGLADPTRILILYELVDGPQTGTALARALGLPQSTVARHLRVLASKGLVISTRRGGVVEYALADARVIQALDLMRAVLMDRIHLYQHIAQ
ncbi:ArsR/SmtB family transcription factor [Thermoflexus sp.]|uniref:ArsR/SmtB family transcription factor n=1 Tax=Thermoflexus sp. TaxID=1969742 RepID=UPI0025F866CA|nr:metalloregulator ArsR/SmtB family transcription factor [Thermoflexus sp.]MCS7350221.1 metalloregulator ArsR/SmtB family transcription factor [Thermoflexus sp.]MCX7691492.1 metalloregulator ArsR/SmtB family transcription factor [Thermoflexus sp.]MDW8179672.1 metalloregulator ArsR/SmtB family transcription factor [Anaerolineae bacterium]